MNRLAPICLALAVILAAAPAAGECLDYTASMPLVGQTVDADGLIAVDVWQSWAFAIDGLGHTGRLLTSFSIHDPELPFLVTTVPVPDGAADLVIKDGLAYVRTWSYGDNYLVVFDIGDPTQMQELGRLAVTDKIADLDVEGNLCALAVENEGVWLVDVSDPSLMGVVGVFPISGIPDASSVDLRDQRCLVGVDDHNDGWIHWLDVSDPTAPLSLDSLRTDWAILDVHLLGDRAEALVTRIRAVAHLDLSDPNNLVLGPDRSTVGDHLVIAGDLALNVYKHLGDCLLLDVADPTAVRWLAPRRAYAYDAAPKSSFLVLARGENGLGVALLPGPAEVPIVGADYSGYGGDQILATGLEDILLCRRRTLDDVRLVDVSDHANPVVRGSHIWQNPTTAAVLGTRAYVVGEDGCMLLDFADPGNPLGLANVDLPGTAVALLWEEDLLFEAAGQDGLILLDATDPTVPVELGRLDTSGSVLGVVRLDATHVVIGDNANGAKVVDVSNPQVPVLVGEIVGGIHGQVLVTSGTRCFVGGTLIADVVELDLSDPANPVRAATLTLPSSVNALLVHGDQLWIAHGQGQTVYDLGEPGTPLLAGSLGTHTPARGLAPAGDLVATTVSYLQLLRAPCPAVIAVGEAPPPARAALVASPNPFNPTTRLSIDLPAAGNCRLAIFDLAGRRVRTLWSGPLAAGERSLVWNGRDDRGRTVPSGVYLARLVAPGTTHSVKLTLVR